MEASKGTGSPENSGLTPARGMCPMQHTTKNRLTDFTQFENNPTNLVDSFGGGHLFRIPLLTDNFLGEGGLWEEDFAPAC